LRIQDILDTAEIVRGASLCTGK